MSQQARTAGSKLEGSCACGAVKVSVNGETMNGICLELQGQPKSFTTRSSNNYDVNRWFCSECGSGTHLTMPDPSMMGLMGGLFPPGSIAPPTKELFCKNRESWEKSYGENVRECDEQPNWEAEAAEREKAAQAQT
ncbi:hypothetical protein EHS25_007168 [Saitozyma podzolica]|uniref:CENP-V/GFA domain-containing protein n=1 Tax=Saitozyma podzolica TaxID=1890683 RepID=A0A427XPD2_9TREE|nr:hypothetical protein EHS25_007168 [Saitozyma podzolica]